MCFTFEYFQCLYENQVFLYYIQNYVYHSKYTTMCPMLKAFLVTFYLEYIPFNLILRIWIEGESESIKMLASLTQKLTIYNLNV